MFYFFRGEDSCASKPAVDVGWVYLVILKYFYLIVFMRLAWIQTRVHYTATYVAARRSLVFDNKTWLWFIMFALELCAWYTIIYLPSARSKQAEYFHQLSLPSFDHSIDKVRGNIIQCCITGHRAWNVNSSFVLSLYLMSPNF